MSTNLDNARARLRAADLADPVGPPDAAARALLERIVTDSSAPVRVRKPRRRLVLAGAAVAAVAAVATAGVVTTPWSHGHPANGAFAVERRSDGSIHVAVNWRQLHDPAALNAKLAELHARTIVMEQTDRCRSAVELDPAHDETIPADQMSEAPAWMRTHRPWMDYYGRARGDAFTIRPSKIPAGDTLVIPYKIHQGPATGEDNGWATLGDLIVLKVPPCVSPHTSKVIVLDGVPSR